MFDTIPMNHRPGLRISLFTVRTPDCSSRSAGTIESSVFKNRARLQKNPVIETGEFLRVQCLIEA